jgi:hypothetical protein
MGQVLGSKARLVMDFETIYKTDPGTPAGLVMPFNTFNLKGNRAKNSAQTITGTRNPVKPFDGVLAVSGDAIIPVDANAFAYWLKACFGAPTTTGTGPYTHEFKVGDLMPSMVMETRFSDNTSVITFAKRGGCKIASFSMSIGGDNELVANFQIEGATETLSGAAYDASPTTISLDRFENFEATITEGGSAITTVTGVDFNVNFGLKTDLYTIGGGGTRANLPEGLLEVTGSVTALFDSTSLLNKAINSTESSILINFTSGTNGLEIALNELQYERNSPGIEGPQGIEITLPFVAYMDDHAAASVIIANLINDIASY